MFYKLPFYLVLVANSYRKISEIDVWEQILEPDLTLDRSFFFIFILRKDKIEKLFKNLLILKSINYLVNHTLGIENI